METCKNITNKEVTSFILDCARDNISVFKTNEVVDAVEEALNARFGVTNSRKIWRGLDTYVSSALREHVKLHSIVRIGYGAYKIKPPQSA